MSFIAVLIALLIEQLKPATRGWMQHLPGAWMRWTAHHFDAGHPSHAWVVWGMTVLVPSLAVGTAFLLLELLPGAWGLLFEVAVLYFCLGFRQFSHHFTLIRDALDAGDERLAREMLGRWQGQDASEWPRTELLRHVIEHSVMSAHRHVFGVFFWFVACAALGLGPTGAVLYRLADAACRCWARPDASSAWPLHPGLGALSQRLFEAIDHLPARLTAFGFAVVGNFEEAVNAWRRDAGLWARPGEGVVLAAAAGALGVRLGGPQDPPATATPLNAEALDPSPPMPDLGPEGEIGLSSLSTAGAAPVLAHLRSMVGLVWRSMVLWMLLLALLSIAHRTGG